MIWDSLVKFRGGDKSKQVWDDLFDFFAERIRLNRKLWESFLGGAEWMKDELEMNAVVLCMEKIRKGALNKFIEDHENLTDEDVREKETKAYIYFIIVRDCVKEKQKKDQIDRKSQSVDAADGENGPVIQISSSDDNDFFIDKERVMEIAFDKVVDFIEKKDARGTGTERKPIYFNDPRFVDINNSSDFENLVWSKSVVANNMLNDEGKNARVFILFMPWEKCKLAGFGKYTLEKYIAYIKSKGLSEKLSDSTESGRKVGIESRFHEILTEEKVMETAIDYWDELFKDLLRDKFETRKPKKSEKNSEN